MIGTYRKRLLPNYAVFDEARYFTPGNETDPMELYLIGGVKVGVSICEDIWSPDGPLAEQAAGGAELAVNINASPYHLGKAAYRERMLATRAADSHAALVYVNQVGGQDELVFDGCSLVFDADGKLLARGPQFVEDLLVVDVPIAAVYRQRLLDPRGRESQAPLPTIEISTAPVREGAQAVANPLATPLDPIAELYEALVLGTRDYIVKNGFSDVVIGLSGGIDSTLVAVDRRRRDRRRARARRVDAVAVLVGPLPVGRRPARRQPRHRLPDDLDRARLLGVPRDARRRAFEGRPPGLTQENLQSRCRGQVLMALSNEFGWMVLTTGNKSEMAVGYFTIYGDSVGGYAVIKDVLKTAGVRPVPLRQRPRRSRGDARERAHQAAVGRAAPRPARRPEPAALRGARPDPRACTSRRTARRARSSSSATTRQSCAG